MYVTKNIIKGNTALHTSILRKPDIIKTIGTYSVSNTKSLLGWD